MNYITKILSKCSLLRFCISYIKYHKRLKFSYSSRIGNGSSFEGSNVIGAHSWFKGVMGYGSYIGNNSSLYAKIGRFVSIGPSCMVITGRHPYTYPFVSTSPIFYSTKKQCGVNFVKETLFIERVNAEGDFPVSIGHDVWINAGVKIVQGVKIGDGTVVLSGAVVTKDTPPFSIVGGIPAKVIKYRFNPDDIKFIEKSKWWDWPIQTLKKNCNALCDIELFKKL